jgi:hypothetical protein
LRRVLRRFERPRGVPAIGPEQPLESYWKLFGKYMILQSHCLRCNVYCHIHRRRGSCWLFTFHEITNTHNVRQYYATARMHSILLSQTLRPDPKSTATSSTRCRTFQSDESPNKFFYPCKGGYFDRHWSIATTIAFMKTGCTQNSTTYSFLNQPGKAIFVFVLQGVEV